MTSQEKRKQELKKKKMIFLIWAVFILIVGGCIFFFVTNYDKLKKASDDKKEEKVYEKNSDSKVTILVRKYLTALTDCDQQTLKSLVTDPSQFDNMTIYISRSNNVTNYSDIDCYILPGMTDNSYLCYAVSYVSLKGVKSTPMDIMVFYIVNVDGEYLINNEVDPKIQDYIDQKTLEKDIQDVYRMVKEDEDRCYEEDETLRKFYDRISGKDD